MLQPLTTEQQNWVDETLARLTLEEQAGQLLCPIMPHFQADDWVNLLEKVPLGSMFIRNMPGANMRNMLEKVQASSSVPLLVAADLEHGAMAIADSGTVFPLPMAAGAANDPDLIKEMGRATATEARHHGLHWTFSPVVDLNLNFNNPITNIRSMSDSPERVTRLAVPLIESLQANGRLAATAKHFPGDGVDDRDHHITGSVNSLPIDQWYETYGRVFKSVIDAGVFAIMPGHISLPDYQGYQENPDDAPPATFSPELLQDLLRGELGFDGLIVSDATPMVGLTSRLPSSERAVRSIAAGIDMYLFPDPVADYEYLLAGVKDGRLSADRVQDAVRRVLTLKARLSLHTDPFGPAPTAEDTQAFQMAAEKMADKSVTVLKSDGRPPFNLAPEASVLTVTVGEINPMLGFTDLTVFDEELTQRGYQVAHLLNPSSDELRKAVSAGHEAVFINVYTMPFAVMGTVRTVVGHLFSWGWRSIFTDHPQVVYTAFGNPYLLNEMPHIPNLVATYGATAVQQESAVKVWLGEIEAVGDCPVKMPKTQIRRLEL